MAIIRDLQRRLYSLQNADLESGVTQMHGSRKRRAVSFVFIFAVSLFFIWSTAAIFVSEALLLWLIVLSGWIVSLTLHEYGHAIVAFSGGDRSVLARGYLNLNFLLYIDPIMSILIPSLMLILGGIPLPGGSVLIDSATLRSAHWDALTSIAGPAMNIVCALFLRIGLALIGLLSRTNLHKNYVYHGCFGQAWSVLIYLQGLAAILNLLPLPPLDGWGVISPYLSSSCFIKAWIHKSSWNWKTASLTTFAIIFILGSVTPSLRLLHEPISFIFQLDKSLLASGLAVFSSALRFP